MKNYTEEELGWNSFLENQLSAFPSTFVAGRISSENKNNYRLLLPGVGEVMAECTGKLLFNALDKSELPKVGDWVLVTYFPDENKALIMELLERRNTLSRKVAGEITEAQVMATHVDKVLIVQGLDDNFNLNRLIRSMVLVRECGIIPLIVLNKADLITDMDAYLNPIQEHLGDVKVMVLSALNDQGLEPLENEINAGETLVLLGSSGAGKSTLLNRLLGEQTVTTGAVRAGDAKGRHTTTRREMHILPNGGILIDTPGTRELQLLSTKDSLTETFDQISELAYDCRYKDCTHTVEAGCAVLEALDDGVIPELAYENYLKLRNEDAYMESRTDQKAFLEKKAQDKKLHKQIRNIYKSRKQR
ncbi:MAG: ribosome small subunit-dependent GTPase A [Roseivirga sp.]|nr:ribosome small subunit-dependent GTPase A [Roseivirga sp.]